MVLMSRKRLLLLIVFAFSLLVAGCVFAHRPIPLSTDSGENLAGKIEQSINKKAWEETCIISWRFAGAEHIWDKCREFHLYKRGTNIVQHSLAGKGGIHIHNGEETSTPQKWITKAYNAWINDSFWLNPLVKLRDQGVELGSLRYDGQKTLLVHYTTGGNTPGDRFLWFFDDQYRPTMWRMWVSIIPIGGISSSWEGWQQLSTGAWVATKHSLGPLTLDLSPVHGAKHWSELYREDPFSALIQKNPLLTEEEEPRDKTVP